MDSLVILLLVGLGIGIGLIARGRTAEAQAEEQSDALQQTQPMDAVHVITPKELVLLNAAKQVWRITAEYDEDDEHPTYFVTDRRSGKHDFAVVDIGNCIVEFIPRNNNNQKQQQQAKK